MNIKIILNSLSFTIFWLVGQSFGALVNVDISSSQPQGTAIVPENRQTSSLKVSFNETVQGNNVSVACEVIKPSRGSTQVVFIKATALVGQNGTTVKYTIVSPGQAVTVQCSAQSEINNTQFTFLSSKGKTGLLQVTKAPIVTICDDPVLVTSSTDCLTVQVELSEVVTGSFPAVVNCSTVNNIDGPHFQFEATIINSGQKTAKVPFVTISKGKSTQSVQVICKAQTYKVTMISSWFICGDTVTPTTAVPPTAAPSNVTSNVTTAIPITVPTAAPPTVINITRFETSILGVDYFQYLLDNSAGSSVTFILDPLAMQFHPSSITVRGGYSFILSLNTPLTVPLDIECSLTLLPTGSVNTSAINCPSEPVASVTLTSSSVRLQLAQTELQFEKSKVSKTLTISIDGVPTSQISDLVLLSCCPKSTAILKPASAVAFLFVDLHRYQPINSNAGSTSTSPLDVDLTCPCNLKEGQCDTGCCCDKDCSSSEISSFSCIKGFFGGDSIERPFEFSCQSTWPDATDLHPLLCVTTSSSPFIGYWYNYTTPRSATDVPGYKTLLQAANRKTSFSYQPVTQSQTSSDGTYKLGTSIKTAANSNDNKYLTATLGTLVLPNKVFSGLCSQTVPVRFLENSESTCVIEVVESLCNPSSSLSASSYLMPRDITSPPCPVPAAVLRGGTLSQNQNEQPDLADVEVQYFCTAGNSANLSPWRCAFDDGKTAPPLPVLNQTSRTCSNVVLNVTYRLDVFGQNVNKVIATVTLGNVKVQSQSYSNIVTSESVVNTMTQYYRTTFVRVSNTSIESSVVSRSGNPGYVRGLPVLALTPAGENSTLTNLPMQSPSGDGLCTSASSNSISYGETASTGCMLKLTMDDMRNCSRVRDLVIANQEAFLRATHVGRTGNARAIIDEDWLPIIRGTIREPLTGASVVGECSDIPYGLGFEFLVSEAGRYKGVPQMEIVGLKVSYKYTTWQFQCVSGYGLSCLAPSNNVTQSNVVVTPTVVANVTVSPSVTVSVNASVNGSSAGKSNNSSPDRGSDSNSYSPREMYFLLETSVVFIQVSSTPAAKVKRSTDQSGICYQDICEEELFYPLSPAYQGETSDKIMTYFLSLLFVALATFTFTRPWG